jgi:hypothetical protein
MKGKVGVPVMRSAAIVFSLGIIGSTASAEDLSKATSSHFDPSHLTYARLYCTPDNESHFAELRAVLTKQNFAPLPPRSTLEAISQCQMYSSQDSRRTGAPPTW